MAKRRMFSLDIVDSDAFLEMPASTQNLYFHLGMRADDDGFLNNPKKVARMIGSSDDDLKILIAKRFLLQFDSGVVVIKHWRMNNYLQKDRYTPTAYQEEFAQLSVKKNGSYTECIQNVYSLDTQSSIDKYSKEKELDQSICDRLTDKEWDSLESTYDHLLELIDLIDSRLKLSKEVIKNPYAYIISVAKAERWATK